MVNTGPYWGQDKALPECAQGGVTASREHIVTSVTSTNAYTKQ